jgi:hypothetical protein
MPAIHFFACACGEMDPGDDNFIHGARTFRQIATPPGDIVQVQKEIWLIKSE